MLKTVLERAGERRSITVYRDTDIIVSVWLKDSDDEYRIFEIACDLMEKFS